MRTELENCPPKNDIVDYLLGKLPETVVPDFESHVERCNFCEETIRGLAATDTLSELTSQAFQPPTNANPTIDSDSFVEKLIHQIKEQTSSLTAPDPILVERAGEVLRRLSVSDNEESLGRLADYEIASLIGAGSTGIVFKAQDSQLKRTVALKVLLPSLGDAAKQRFISEAQAVASIDHPNVVAIYQVGEANDLAFLAMQWIEGETLEDRLKRVTFVAEPQLKKIAAQIASGLQAAHTNNLIHRDIKPANIWLAKETDDIKILDFGLARIADDDPHLTNTGMLAGTPNFMSPEQSRGLELDGRSDLFSLGCTIYRASTGKLPFGAGGVLATLQAIQTHHPAPPVNVNPGISKDFSDLTMCMLDKQPANRPGCASDLVVALQSPRSKWPFVVTDAQSPGKVSTARTQTSIGSGWRWIAAIFLVAMAAWGWSLFGQQIIRIATDQGELVIETEEDDIQVEVVAGDDVVKVINTWAEQCINLKSGEYELRPKNKDDSSLSYSISKENIVLRRGSQQIVSISIMKTGDANSNSNTEARTQEPLFEGQTFAGWLETLKRERSKNNIAKGMEALAELSNGNKELQLQTIAAIRPWIRKHGSKFTSSDQDWPTAINQALSHLPPEILVEFIIEELRNGNAASRGQLVWITTLGAIYVDDVKTQLRQIQELRQRIETIVDVGCEAIDADPMNSRLIREVVGYAIGTAFSKTENGYYTGVKEYTSEFHYYLHQKLLNATYQGKAVLKTFLALQLVGSKNKKFQSSAQRSIFDSLINSDLPTDQLAKLYFGGGISGVPDNLTSEFAGTLRDVFDSKEVKSKLLSYALQHSHWPAYKLDNESNKSHSNMEKLEQHILARLEEKPSRIEAAKDWLMDLKSQDSIHTKQVKKLLDIVLPKPKKVEVKPLQRKAEFDPNLNYGPKTFLSEAKEYLQNREHINRKTAQQTLNQLPHIAKAHPDLLPELVEIAKTVMRKTPNNTPLLSSDLGVNGFSENKVRIGWFQTERSILSLLNVAKPEQIYELTLSEIANGSHSSLILLDLMLDLSRTNGGTEVFLYARQREKLGKLIGLFRKNLDLILARVFERLQKDDDPQTYSHLTSFVIHVLLLTQESRYDSWDARKFIYWNEFGPWLRKQLLDSDNNRVNAFICINLVNPNSAEFSSQKLGMALVDTQLSKETTSRLFLATRYHFGANFEKLIPYLIDFFKSDELVDRVATTNKKFGNREAVRNHILELFRARKDHSSLVLAWLDDVAASGTIYSENAKTTANAIRSNQTVSGTTESDATGLESGESNPAKRTLTYNGRNIDKWTDVVDTELADETLVEAAKAIGILIEKSDHGAAAAHTALLKILDGTSFENSMLPYEIIVAVTKIESAAPAIKPKANKAILRLVNDHELIKGKAMSTTQGGELVQDSIGHGAIYYFKNTHDFSQAVSLINDYIVNGTNKSRLRLHDLVSSGTFLEALESNTPEFKLLLQNWFNDSKTTMTDRLAARRLFQLVAWKTKDNSIKEIAKELREELLRLDANDAKGESSKK